MGQPYDVSATSFTPESVTRLSDDRGYELRRTRTSTFEQHRREMSLNGLDDVKVKEAHDAAVAEPGGW